LLTAARRPGTIEARKAAYTALQTQLTAGRYLLPIAFADEVVVVGKDVQGVVVQPVADPSDRFWDVLTWRLANDR
jgi:ABC-type oligopeptide transport system substrate-binding subunit